MLKCQHAQNITLFCYHEKCYNKQASGCQSCMTKYHRHSGKQKFVDLKQLKQLIEKYGVKSTTKPKCRVLQESILKYSAQIKKQFQVFIDNICFDLMNQIGHPFLCSTNIFPTYKRLKKQQYSKINPKQFRQFYELSHNLNEKQFLQKQSNLYLTHLQNKSLLIQHIQQSICKVDQYVKGNITGYSYNHDNSNYKGIISMTTSILKGKGMDVITVRVVQPDNSTQSHTYSNSIAGSLSTYQKSRERVSNYTGDKRFDNISENKSKDNNSKETDQYEQGAIMMKKPLATGAQNIQALLMELNLRDKQIEQIRPTNTINIQIDQPQQPKSPQLRKRPNRLSSIDKQLAITINNRDRDPAIRQRKKQMFQLKQIKMTDYQHPQENNKYDEKSSPLRRHQEVRDTDLNVKKQKLVDMMKNKDQESPNRFKNSNSQLKHQKEKEKQQKQKDKQREKQKEKQIEKQKEKQKQRQRQKRRERLQVKQQQAFCQLVRGNTNGHKFSASQEGQSFDSNNQQRSLFVAHSNLPIEDQKQIYSSPKKQKSKQQTIMIPFQSPVISEKTRTTNSPILQSIKKQQRSSISPQKNKLKLTPANTNTKNQQIITQLTQNQQKAAALFIASLTMKIQDAIPCLQKCLKYTDNNLSAAEYLSYLYIRMNRPKDALNLCNSMLKKLASGDNDNQQYITNAYHLQINRSAAYNLLGRYSQTISILNICLKSNKSNEKIYKNIADAYFSLGMTQKAIQNYKKCLQIDDLYDEAHYNLSICYFDVQNLHVAKFQLLKAIQIAPENQEYLQFKKQLGLRMKQF